jgi:hypothetical protein
MNIRMPNKNMEIMKKIKKYRVVKFKKPDNLEKVYKLREEIRDRMHNAFKRGVLKIFMLFH